MTLLLFIFPISSCHPAVTKKQKNRQPKICCHTRPTIPKKTKARSGGDLSLEKDLCHRTLAILRREKHEVGKRVLDSRVFRRTVPGDQ